MAKKTAKIPIPWEYRWKRIRFRYLPVLTFFLCGYMAYTLWHSQFVTSNAVGQVAARNAPATSLNDGVLVAIPGKPAFAVFDSVKQGDELATLDSKQLDLQIETANLKIKELEAKLEAEEEEILQDTRKQDYDRIKEVLKLQEEISKYDLDILDRQIDINTDEIEIKRQTQKLESLRKLYDETHYDIQNTLIRIDIVQAHMTSSITALNEAKVQKKSTQARLEALPESVKINVARILQPIRQEILVEQSQIREIENQKRTLVITAPISGKIIDIHKFPGESVRAGDRVMTIADGQGQYIETFIRNTQRINPVKGMIVEVRTRLNRHEFLEATVEEVGVQFQEVPTEQLFNPQSVEYGLPVRISYPAGLKAIPGELVKLKFIQEGLDEEGAKNPPGPEVRANFK